MIFYTKEILASNLLILTSLSTALVVLLTEVLDGLGRQYFLDLGFLAVRYTTNPVLLGMKWPHQKIAYQLDQNDQIPDGQDYSKLYEVQV